MADKKAMDKGQLHSAAVVLGGEFFSLQVGKSNFQSCPLLLSFDRMNWFVLFTAGLCFCRHWVNG